MQDRSRLSHLIGLVLMLPLAAALVFAFSASSGGVYITVEIF